MKTDEKKRIAAARIAQFRKRPSAEETRFLTLEQAAAATGRTVHNIRDYIQRGRIARD